MVQEEPGGGLACRLQLELGGVGIGPAGDGHGGTGPEGQEAGAGQASGDHGAADVAQAQVLQDHAAEAGAERRQLRRGVQVLDDVDGGADGAGTGAGAAGAEAGAAEGGGAPGARAVLGQVVLVGVKADGDGEDGDAGGAVGAPGGVGGGAALWPKTEISTNNNVARNSNSLSKSNIGSQKITTNMNNIVLVPGLVCSDLPSVSRTTRV